MYFSCYCKIDKAFFPPHGWHLSTSLITGRAALTKCDFKFLLFLKPILGTSRNTFLWPSSPARTRCHLSEWLFRCLNTGYYVTLNVSLLLFPLLFSLSSNSFLGIFLAQSISFPYFLYSVAFWTCLAFKEIWIAFTWTPFYRFYIFIRLPIFILILIIIIKIIFVIVFVIVTAIIISSLSMLWTFIFLVFTIKFHFVYIKYF